MFSYPVCFKRSSLQAFGFFKSQPERTKTLPATDWFKASPLGPCLKGGGRHVCCSFSCCCCTTQRQPDRLGTCVNLCVCVVVPSVLNAPPLSFVPFGMMTAGRHAPSAGMNLHTHRLMPHKKRKTQLNSQLNSIQLNSFQLISTQLISAQLNLTPLTPTALNSTQLDLPSGSLGRAGGSREKRSASARTCEEWSRPAEEFRPCLCKKQAIS